jgi:hypothetical protein
MPQQTFPGMAQGTGPHVTAVLVVLGQMVANGGYSTIYLNRRYNSIPGFSVNPNAPGVRNAADLVGIRRASAANALLPTLIDICEVLSIGQDRQEPITSATEGMNLLTDQRRRGDINIFNTQGTEILESIP